MIKRNSEPEKIFVELDDEITIVVEKVRSAISDHVVLIVPENALLMSSLVSLKILQKELVTTDKPCVIVTKDNLGLSLSHKANLVTVENASDITTEVWDKASQILDEEIRRQHTKKDELLEKRKLQKVEKEEVEEERVNNILDQKDREQMNEVTAKESVFDKSEDEFEKAIYRKPKRLNAKIIKHQDRIFAQGGDITNFDEAKDEVKIDELRDTLKFTNKNFNDDHLVNYEEKVERQSEAKLDKNRKGLGFRIMITSFFSKIIVALRNFGHNIFNFFKKGGKVKFIVPAILIFLIIFAILSFTVFSSAKVDLTVEKQAYSKVQEVNAKLNADLNAFELPLETLIVDINGSQSADTSQNKDIGVAKATGKVTFYNSNLGTSLNVPANTTLTIKVNGTNLTYITTQAVTVNGLGGVNYKDVNVVAENPGVAYNIANQGLTQFTISNPQAGLIATMTPSSTFTGGTSKTSKVVAKSDIDNLKKSLTESLKTQANEAAKTKFEKDYVIVTPNVDFQIVSEKPSAQVGQEASTLDYEIVGKATVKGVSKQNINDLTKKLAEAEILTKTGSEILSTNNKYDLVKYEKDVAQLSVTINAEYYVVPDTNEIKETLKGKSVTEGKTYLESLNSNIEKAEVYPVYLPEFLKKYPTDTQKISVAVVKK